MKVTTFYVKQLNVANMTSTVDALLVSFQEEDKNGHEERRRSLKTLLKIDKLPVGNETRRQTFTFESSPCLSGKSAEQHDGGLQTLT